MCVCGLYCSAQLSMVNMDKRYRNKIIIIIIILFDYVQGCKNTVGVVVYFFPSVTHSLMSADRMTHFDVTVISSSGE